MNWKHLTSISEVEEIKERSAAVPQIIFKHSTRCSISSMAKNRLEREMFPEGFDFYMLDLLRHRDISNKIAQDFNVYHESPQVLVIKNGECIYDESHSAIRIEEILQQAG